VRGVDALLKVPIGQTVEEGGDGVSDDRRRGAAMGQSAVGDKGCATRLTHPPLDAIAD
jgi:hypothetical protein